MKRYHGTPPLMSLNIKTGLNFLLILLLFSLIGSRSLWPTILNCLWPTVLKCFVLVGPLPIIR